MVRLDGLFAWRFSSRKLVLPVLPSLINMLTANDHRRSLSTRLPPEASLWKRIMGEEAVRCHCRRRRVVLPFSTEAVLGLLPRPNKGMTPCLFSFLFDGSGLF